MVIKNPKDAAVKYEDIDLGVMSFVHTKERWLDLGCGTGSLGKAIRDRGNEVDGIEYSAEAVKVSRGRLDHAWQGDVTQPNALLSDKKEYYDCILFGNILEHLTDPWTVLKKYRKYLKPKGKIIVSIPNVCTWTTRLQFFVGYFRYTEVGTFDFTHYRFFNFSTARELIEDAGFRITRITVNPNIIRPLTPLIQNLFGRNPRKGLNRVQVNRRILESPAYKFYERYFHPVETFIANRWKNLLAFSFVFEAKL
jgi:2-polyprenyl-3-methyl-5-hydroxy-6-metoxy-1,4-benzoquinol methylase